MKKTKNVWTNCVFAVLMLMASITFFVHAEVVLPTVIGSNMVVQQGEPVHLWGWADAGEKITIKQSGAVVATTEGAGRVTPWSVKLAAPKPGAVADIDVIGTNTIAITNILAGDVWLCTGQSNMVMTLKKGPWCGYGGVVDEEKEIAAATDGEIRFYLGGGGNDKPLRESKSGWVVCSPENAPRFSAVGYFFARKLRSEIKVPIGVMAMAAGGRPAEWFAPSKVMDGDADFQTQRKAGLALKEELKEKMLADRKANGEYHKLLDVARKKGEKAPPKPADHVTPEEAAKVSKYEPYVDFGFLWDRDIHPVAAFPVRGFVWYQGESNATRGDKYAVLMTKLIQGWRDAWGKPLPFIMVALAGFQNGEASPSVMTVKGDSYPLVREAMVKVSETVADVGVVSAVDVGEEKNIHPHNKKPVGERAAMWALSHVYKKEVVGDGPKVGLVEYAVGKAIVKFTEHADGLVLKSAGGFQLAGADKKFYPAKAELKGKTIEVTAPEVAVLVALRYDFLNYPESTVYNGAGIPALPFRTDDWAIDKPIAP